MVLPVPAGPRRVAGDRCDRRRAVDRQPSGRGPVGRVALSSRAADLGISSLPGCFHLSVDEVAREAEEVDSLGVGGVILFGLPSAKDPTGSEGYADDGVVQEATRAIRAARPELLVITDVCLCEYTSPRPLRRGRERLREVNDKTLELLARQPPSPTPAPARDMVAPVRHDGRARRFDPRLSR